MRKAIIAISIIFTLALIAAGYYLQKSKKIEIVDPFLVIPADAAIILETPDFPELLTKICEKNGIIHRLDKMKWSTQLAEVASVIDSITGRRELREFITGRRVIISFHPGTNGRLTPLAAMSIGPGIGKRRIVSMINSTGARVTEERETGGIRVFVARYGKADRFKQVYFAATAGVLVATPSETLMANALNNKSNGSDIRLQQGFSSVSGAFGNERDNIFILFRNLPGFLNGVVNTPEINEISGVAIAAGGEIDEKEEGLFISGFVATSGSGSGADRIMDLISGTPGVHEVLPSSTICFKTEMREILLSGEPATDPSVINATDIALMLKQYTENEVTTATLKTNSGYRDVVLFRVNNRTQAEEALRSRITGKYTSMGVKTPGYIIEIQGKDDEKVLIYKMPFAGIASMLAQGQKLLFNDTYAVFCRSYLAFSEDPAALVEIVNASLTETTLINDHVYREVEKSLPTKSSFLYYGTSEALTSVVLNTLTPEKGSSLNPDSFSDIGAIGLSLTPSNKMVYSSLSIAYKEEDDDESGVLNTYSGYSSITNDSARSAGEKNDILLWSTNLQAAPVIKPFIFTNHSNNSKEIFVQDASNNIYLISASGKILWKAQIRERVRGDAFMIDYYQNGKNQILFAGKDYLHLIDRNGKYVDRFPVRLKSPASNTLSVFDYESNKDYRLFIAGEDKKIYLYDKSGSTVKGWVPYATTQKITAPVKHFRTGGKDYIVIYDTGSMSVLDRRGNNRVTLKQATGVAGNSSIRLTRGGKLIFADNGGMIHNLDFAGVQEKQKAGDYSGDFFFDYCELDRDGRNEYVIIDKGVLNIYRDDLSLIATVKLPSEKYLVPQILTFSSSSGMIAVTDDSRGLVWLFDSKGNMETGFPVKGAVMPVAVKLSATTGNVIITGGPDNNIYCYKVLK